MNVEGGRWGLPWGVLVGLKGIELQREESAKGGEKVSLVPGKEIPTSGVSIYRMSLLDKGDHSTNQKGNAVQNKLGNWL